MSTTSTHIPIIDFSRSSSTSATERKAVADQLVAACRQVGFAYLINHGVDPSLVAECFAWSKKLFDLSEDDKLKAPHPDGPAVHRGYSSVGLEKVSQVVADGKLAEGRQEVHSQLRQVVDCKESYEVGHEDNSDQPNVWLPEETLPGFRSFMNRFYHECHEAALRILRAIALGVGLPDENLLVGLHSGINNQLRLLHYPSISAKELESGTTARMPAHSDWSSITFLFQDDIGGLEVEDPKHPGSFTAVPPIKDALIMNVGDLLTRWSNDFLRSTSHRVTLPQTTRQDDPSTDDQMVPERYSIPYFVAPDPDLVIECLPTCVDAEHPAKYEPITQREYGRMRAAYHYETKGEDKTEK